MDIGDLRKVIENISEEIKVNFLERRQSKGEITEELNTAVKEINKRERELKFLIGISYHLIESNEQSISKYNSLKTKLSESEVSQKNLIDKIQYLDKNLKETSEFLRQILKIVPEDQADWVAELKQKQKEESLLSVKLSEIDNSLMNVKGEICKIEEQSESINSENSHIKNSISKIESKMNNFQDILEICPQTPVFILETTAKRRSPEEEFFILVIDIQSTQAIKLNSPHMDAICSIPSWYLFRKAAAEGIPFSNWYYWIEEELNRIYIKLLYSEMLVDDQSGIIEYALNLS